MRRGPVHCEGTHKQGRTRMESWIVAVITLSLSLVGSWGVAQKAAGRREREIEMLQERILKIEAVTGEHATAKAVEDMSQRFDRFEGELKRIIRGMVKMATGQKVSIEELLGND